MTDPADTWEAYAHLLARLSPKISHILFAGADGTVWWSSDPSDTSRIQYALALLLRPQAARTAEIDGVLERQDHCESRYGFRIRGSLGEVMGLLVIALPQPEARLDLAAVQLLIKPALDCLQNELSAQDDVSRRATPAQAADDLHSLRRIPTLACESLAGMLATVLLPSRNMTICRTRPGQPSCIENDVLAEMHRHLMIRAQLHGCTLVANRLTSDGVEAAVPYKTISTPLRDDARRAIGVLTVFRANADPDFQSRDAQALELLARKAEHCIRSSFDSLTGLMTRAALIAQAESKIAVCPPASAAHGLLYVDIDQLDVINENHGMHTGDEVIQRVANLLAARAAASDLVARVGADRFAIFLPDCGLEPAARIAEELRSSALRLGGSRSGRPLYVSLSIGVSRLAGRDRSLEQALAAAEQACCAAKQRGRNRVEVCDGATRNADHNRTTSTLAMQAAAALAGDSFELLAQPILPLTSAPADPRFEVLLRMKAVDGTRLYLEKLTGADLIRSIDRWIIEQTIERIHACRELLRRHPAKFWLKLSTASLTHANFWLMLDDLVRRGQIDAGTLGFEIPAGSAAAHRHAIGPSMSRLCEQGISFALDEFGRGSSSLSDLTSLPVSCIKLDGSVSRDLLENPRAQSIVVAVSKLAEAFGLETVAGQVETDAIRARAAQLGVDYGQGFLIGKPISLDAGIHDLPLYSCFATSTGLFDPAVGQAAALRG